MMKNDVVVLIVGEIMIIWYECCWVMLMMIIHALGIDKCVVVFYDILWKWIKIGEVWFWWIWM